MIFLPQWLKYKIVFDDKSTSIAEINIFVIFHSLEPLKTKKEIDKFALRQQPPQTNCTFFRILKSAVYEREKPPPYHPTSLAFLNHYHCSKPWNSSTITQPP